MVIAKLFAKINSFLKRVLKTKGKREKKGVRAEKRDRDAEREKETFQRQRHHQSADDGVDAKTSLSLSLHLYLFSPPLHLFSHAHLWSLKLSLKMRVSSNELFSTLNKLFFESSYFLEWISPFSRRWKTFCERTLCSSYQKQGRNLLCPWRPGEPFVRPFRGLGKRCTSGKIPWCTLLLETGLVCRVQCALGLKVLLSLPARTSSVFEDATVSLLHAPLWVQWILSWRQGKVLSHLSCLYKRKNVQRWT